MFLKDHLGSPIMVVNSSTGAVSQKITYNEFGRILTQTNPGLQPYRFAGGIYDLDTGLLKFGARDYDPELGRWTSKDPIRFEARDTNLYGYVMNDPINFVDPSGLFDVKIGDVTLVFNRKTAAAGLVGMCVGFRAGPVGAVATGLSAAALTAIGQGAMQDLQSINSGEGR